MTLPGRVAAAVLLSFMAIGCSPQIAPPTGLGGSDGSIPPSSATLGSAPATELPPPSTGPFPGEPWTFNGQPAEAGSISLAPGPEHCGWEAATFLTIGWPLGRVPRDSSEARLYIRDPDHLFADRTLAPFIPSTLLPGDAFDTTYRYGADQLWVDNASVDGLVYVVRDGVVEQWPRARDTFGCA